MTRIVIQIEVLTRGSVLVPKLLLWQYVAWKLWYQNTKTKFDGKEKEEMKKLGIFAHTFCFKYGQNNG